MRTVSLQLPPLTPAEAMLLSDLLEEAVAALWRAYGDGMADYLGGVDPEGMPDQPRPDDGEDPVPAQAEKPEF